MKIFVIAFICLHFSRAILAQSCTTQPPSNLFISDSSACSLTLNWSPSLPGSTYKVRYKVSQTQAWTQVSAGTDTFYTFSGLNVNEWYNLSVFSICPDGTKSAVKKLLTHTTACQSSFPNIILILLDDARYDFYSCNGAPQFFQTPNIDRIANEGANFKHNYAVCSLCAPSRASIATGLYPHENGVIDNITQSELNLNLPIIPEILHENGYYTALVGKNHKIFNYDENYFDFWMVPLGALANPTKKFDRGNTFIFLPGSVTDILTDSAIGIMETVNQPFFLWLSYTDPHVPLTPDPEYEDFYNSEQMPRGIDTIPYTSNYPSFMYSLALSRYTSGTSANNLYLETYQVMANLDYNIGRLLTALDTIGELDNTLIIFTSDNGHLLGEHQLNIKRAAYDPSIKTPLFIRYPQWFGPGSVIDDEMTLNIDLFPTILQAANITEPFTSDGTSVTKIFSNETERKSFFYSYYYSLEGDWNKFPYIRAIRDFNFKYVYYGCNSDTTEEFFDLVNDSFEMKNLINDINYDSIIQVYRNQLAASKLEFNDTLAETELSCYIANPSFTKTSFFKKVPNILHCKFILTLPRVLLILNLNLIKR